MIASTHSLSLFGCLAAAFLVPAKIPSAVARRRGPGRPSGRRGTRLALEGDEHGGTVDFIGTTKQTPRAARASVVFLLALGICVPGAAGARAQAVASSEIDAVVDEAARRFMLPPDWIVSVIQAESGGRSSVVSSAGAMGLMQLMPATWQDLRARLDLGPDPFDRHDNIMAGAFYLRQLLDQFGAEGFLAAYNAGPGRYAQYRFDGRPLPAETRRYVASLAPRLGLQDTPAPPDPPRSWRSSLLFVGRDAADQSSDPAALFVSGPLESER